MQKSKWDRKQGPTVHCLQDMYLIGKDKKALGWKDGKRYCNHQMKQKSKYSHTSISQNRHQVKIRRDEEGTLRCRLTKSAAIRAQIQCFEAVHPSTHSIYELLNCVEELVLQKQIQEHFITTEDENLEHGCNWIGDSHQQPPRTSEQLWGAWETNGGSERGVVVAAEEESTEPTVSLEQLKEWRPYGEMLLKSRLTELEGKMVGQSFEPSEENDETTEVATDDRGAMWEHTTVDEEHGVTA